MTRTVLGITSFVFLALWAHRRNLSKSGDTKKASDLAAVKAVSKGIIAADNSSDIRADSVWLPPSGKQRSLRTLKHPLINSSLSIRSNRSRRR